MSPSGVPPHDRPICTFAVAATHALTRTLATCAADDATHIDTSPDFPFRFITAARRTVCASECTSAHCLRPSVVSLTDTQGLLLGTPSPLDGLIA